jgi:hypothetical protein
MRGTNRVNIGFKALVATEWNEVFSGDQTCDMELVYHNSKTVSLSSPLMMEIKIIFET